MGKGSSIPFNRNDGLKMFSAYMQGREEFGLSVPTHDPMKGWENVFDALPLEEKRAWHLTLVFAFIGTKKDGEA